jgi:hypothetical protein
MSNKAKILFVIAIILTAAASRLVKHPFNFTPVVAMAIFAGCYLKSRWGIALPLLAMLLSDYFIGFYDWQVMASVYFSVALAFGLGWLLNKYFHWYFVLGAALASSVSFFLITNFAVWAFFDWYPHTLVGLTNCFTLALPFFRNTLAGDLIYTVMFFGLYNLAIIFSEKYLFSKQRIA